MQSPLPSDLFAHINQLSQRDSSSRPPVELGRARFKDLRSVGHKVERYVAARRAVLRHLTKSSRESFASWLRACVAPSAELPGDGVFCSAMLAGEKTFRLLQPVLAQDIATRLIGLWQRLDPAAPKIQAEALAIPSDVNAPLWQALLRVRPLHDLWERELRRGTFESLLDLLPDAWVIDPTPFPPGAVIPRLELSSWADVERLSSSGRRFVVASRESMEGAVLDATVPNAEWAAAIKKALDGFASEPRVLVEMPVPPRDGEAAPVLVAFYEKKAGRVDGIGALALATEADGSMSAARVVSV